VKEQIMIAIIGGTSFVGSDLLDTWNSKRVVTPYGSCELFMSEKAVFIARQGLKGELPPHRINHHAHITALQQLGAGKIISFGSVGGLDEEYSPGKLVVPHDIFAPFKIQTFHHTKLHFTVPGLDEKLRKQVLSALYNNELYPIDNGTYIEASGPRFETPAEIKWMAEVADIVGMTCASEAILAKELNIPHCIVAMVDNFANGIGEVPLTGNKFKKQVVKNRETVMKALGRILKDIR